MQVEMRGLLYNFALVQVGAFIKVESSRKRQGIALEISHFVRYLGLVEHFCLVVALQLFTKNYV